MNDDFSGIKAIFNNAPIGIFITERGGKIINLNNRLVEIFGYDSLEDVQEHVKDLATDLYVRAEDRQKIMTAIQQGIVRPYEVKFKKKDGSHILTRAYVKPYMTDEEGHQYFIGTVEDLSDKESLETQVEEIRDKYQGLFDNTGDAVFIQKDDVFLDFNSKAKDLFEFEDADRQYYLKDISPEYQPDGRTSEEVAQENIEAALAGEIRRFEYSCVSTSGKQIMTEVTISKLNIDIPDSIISIVRDITSRKEIEKSLRESEERYRYLFSKAPVGIVRTNLNGDILLVNQKVATMFGYDDPEIFQKVTHNIVDLYADKSDRVNFLNKISKEELVDVELSFLKQKTELVRTHIIAEAEKDEQGNILYITAFVEEITEKHKMQKEIRERQALLSSLINCLPFELFVADMENNILVQNRYSLEFWGDHQGENMLDLEITQPTKDSWTRNMARIRESESLEYEMEVNTEENQGYLHRIMAPLMEDNVVKGAISMSIDITQRVLLEKKIRENESMLQSIISSLPNELWVVDNNNKVLMQSDFSIKKWGDFVGRYTDEFQSVDSDPKAWERLLDRIKKGESVDYEAEIVIDSKVLYTRRIVAPLLSENEILGYLTISFDITQLKRLQKELEHHRDHLEDLVKERTDEIAQLNEELLSSNEELNASNEVLVDQRNKLQDLIEELRQTQKQLVQSEKMASIGTLTAGIAHEINNPVNFISSGITGLEVLLEDIIQNIKRSKEHHIIAGDESSKRKGEINEVYKSIISTVDEIPGVLDSIRNGVDRTTDIVKGLRTFSRLDTESQIPADVNEILDSTLTILHNKYKNRIEIKRNYGKIEAFYCYPGKLGQVFLNLLMNAIQAIPEKGSIEVLTKCHSRKKEVVISIKDNGNGMSEEVRSRVFDPFYTTKEVGDGTGLGLSIAHGIIEEHSGKIKVNSKPGEGTEFIVHLPFRQ